MSKLMEKKEPENMTVPQEEKISLENGLEIIDENIRKKYLARLKCVLHHNYN